MRALMRDLAVAFACGIVAAGSASADPAHERPVILASAQSDAYWLLLAPFSGSAEYAERGSLTQVRGYYLIPKEVALSVKKDASGRNIDVIIASFAGMTSAGGEPYPTNVPRGVEYLSPNNLVDRVQLVMSDELVSGLKELGAGDPSAELDYVDLSQWPREQIARSQKLASLDPQAISAAAIQAFDWNKQFRFRLSRQNGEFGDTARALLGSGFSIRVDGVGLRASPRTASFQLPDPSALAVGPAGEAISFATAFDRINSLVYGQVRSQAGFDAIEGVLPQSYLRASFVGDAFRLYYAAADGASEPGENCGDLRVRLRPSAQVSGSFRISYFVPELGSVTTRLKLKE